MKKILLALILTLCLPASALAARGYQSRACGFDMDGDGVIGEPVDDCHVCSGTPANGIPAQAQLYVNCTSGSDAAAGTAAAPLKTLAAAEAASSTSTIICFTGTCAANSIDVHGGAALTYTRPQSGNEQRAFDYPQSPHMYVGWDTDADGDYPPHDAGNTSIVDCGGASGPFDNPSGLSYVELAHFTVQNCTGTGTDATIFKNNQGGDFIYEHDLFGDRLNTGVNGGVTLMDSIHTDEHNLAVENVWCEDCGGQYAVFRTPAGSSAPLSHHYRIKNVTYNWKNAPTGGTSSIFDIWGHFGSKGNADGIELIDSVFDCQLDEWNPVTCTGADMETGFQGAWIVGNEFIDHNRALVVNPQDFGGLADTLQRNVADITFSKNYVHANSTLWSGSKAIQHVVLNGGSASADAGSPYEGIEDFTAANNFFVCTGSPGCSAAFYIDGTTNAAGATFGTFSILDNTIVSAAIDTGTNYGLLYSTGTRPFGSTTLVVKGNIFATTSTTGEMVDINASSHFSTFQFDNNVYSPGAAWDSKAAARTTVLTTWRSNIGGDAAARQCLVKWAQTCPGSCTTLPTTNVHLDETDTCAAGFGVSLASVPKDYDGETRASPHSIGADHFTVSGGGTTTTTTTTPVVTTTTTTLPVGAIGGRAVCYGCTCIGCVLR